MSTTKDTTAKTTTGPAAPEKRSDIRKVKTGSVFSRHSFGTVRRQSSWECDVENVEGTKWTVSGDLIEKEFSFADQHDVDVSTSRSSVIGVVVARPYTAMTVTFRKKVEPNEVADDLFLKRTIVDDLLMGEEKAQKEWRKRVSLALAGEVRVMAGYHTGEHDAHGRLKFNEIVDGKAQQRLIDPRTIEEVICHRARYQVKD